jgi:hypothetical protein
MIISNCGVTKFHLQTQKDIVASFASAKPSAQPGGSPREVVEKKIRAIPDMTDSRQN